MGQHYRFGKFITQPLHWVFGLALLIRLFACLSTHIINPDGIHYIYQAQSIYYGQWDMLTACNIKYISPLPILIVLSYTVFRDWVIAGQFVSLAFSFGTLFPLYFLLKRFFDQTIAILTLLAYALIPVFVSRSADIVRDPIFWFLICSGMLLFTKHFDTITDKYSPKYLIYSAVLFLLATWTRVEGVVFFVASGCYLLFHVSELKYKRLLGFFIPVLLIIIAIGVSTLVVPHLDRFYLKRIDKIGRVLSQFGNHYQEVRDLLAPMRYEPPAYFGQFFHELRKVLWAVPLFIIFNTILDAFFYPNVLLLLLGFKNFGLRLARNQLLPYFLWIAFSGLLILYIYILQSWLIFNRFMSIVIYPSFIIIGYGLENIFTFFKSRYDLKHHTLIIGIVVIMLAFGIGKSLRPIHEDKSIYPQIGDIIASKKMPDTVTRIMDKPGTVINWVFFYAHRNYPGPLCNKELIPNIPKTYSEMIQTMKKEKIVFLLYEERKWETVDFNLMSQTYIEDFDVLGQWHHEDTGDIILMSLKTK